MPATPRLLSLAHPFRGGQLLHGLHQALRLQRPVCREAFVRFYNFSRSYSHLNRSKGAKFSRELINIFTKIGNNASFGNAFFERSVRQIIIGSSIEIALRLLKKGLEPLFACCSKCYANSFCHSAAGVFRNHFGNPRFIRFAAKWMIHPNFSKPFFIFAIMQKYHCSLNSFVCDFAGRRVKVNLTHHSTCGFNDFLRSVIFVASTISVNVLMIFHSLFYFSRLASLPADVLNVT